jgi:chromosome segregation ATPase
VLNLLLLIVCCMQSSKLQALYDETQSALEASDARVKQLSDELTTAQQEAEKLRKEMRTLQVGTQGMAGRACRQRGCM